MGLSEAGPGLFARRGPRQALGVASGPSEDHQLTWLQMTFQRDLCPAACSEQGPP